MKTKRKERTLDELFDLTDRLFEPEITPVLKGNFRIQGPVDELDHQKRGHMEPCPRKRTRKGSTDSGVRIKAKSGTCNVCASPCTSCMHINKTLSPTVSKVEGEQSGEICKGKESNCCSSNDVGISPLSKGRACEQQHTSSETSNLLSVTSSYDSFSENAQSKATLKTSNVVEVLEDEMLQKLSSSKKIDDELLAQESDVASHKVSLLDMDQRTLQQCDDQQGMECNDDNISCVTGLKDTNGLGRDHNIDSERKNVSDSSASACSSLAEGFEKVAQNETALDCVIGCKREREDGQHSSSIPCTYTTSSIAESCVGVVRLSSKSEPSEPLLSNNVCVMSDTLKFQDPCSHSQSQERPSADSSMEHVESAFVGPKVPAVGSGDIPPDTGYGEAGFIGKQNVTSIVTSPCLESDTKLDSNKPTEIPVSTSGLDKQLGDSSVAVELTDMQEHPLKHHIISKIECSASDAVEVDVKVCDICGDAGREDMLAICSRCSDGAEHTYCMRVKLDKVPEFDWLCEECQFKEDADKQKQLKLEVVLGSTDALPLNDGELLHKSEKEAQEAESNQSIRSLASVSPKRQAATMELASSSINETVEARVVSPGTASSSKKAVLSRENSFKSLANGGVKPSNPVSLVRSISAKSSQETARSLTATGFASMMQERLQSSQGLLSKPITFHNSKPKVKQISENVYQKQKLIREFPNGGTRKDGSIRKYGKSLSYNSTSSSFFNMDGSKPKLLFSHTSPEDNIGLKQGKDLSILERKKSLKSDQFVINTSPSSGIGRTSPRVAQKNEKLSASSKSINFLARKGSDNAAASGGSTGVKKLSSNEVRNADRQNPCQVGPKKDRTASSWVAEESRNCYDRQKPDFLPQAQESVNCDGNMKNSSLSCCKNSVTSAGKFLKCRQDSEKDQVSQIRASALSCVRVEAKRIKDGKEAVAAAASTGKVHQSNKCPVLSDTVSGSNADLNNELALKRQSLNPIYLGNMVATDARNKLDQRQEHDDLNVVRPVSDETKLYPYTMNLPLKASILGNPLRILAIPEHEYIWKGAFEVQRSYGNICEVSDGIQAHLSTCASPKVLQVVGKFSSKVQLEEVSRLSIWPSQFQNSCATEDNIALYFFAKDLKSYGKSYKNLVENMLKNDLALRGNFDGVELLIFTSNYLPEKSQRWNRLFFLWAVFRERIKISVSSSPQQRPCGATIVGEPLVQHQPTAVKAEMTDSENVSIRGVMNEESSLFDRLHKAQNAETSSCPSEEYSSEHGRQMSGLPGSLLLQTMHSNELCLDVNSSMTIMKEAFIDPRNRKGTVLQPLPQAADEVKPVGMSSGSSDRRQACWTSKLPDKRYNPLYSSKIHPVSSPPLQEKDVPISRDWGLIDLDNSSNLINSNTNVGGSMQVEPIVRETSGWELRCTKKRSLEQILEDESSSSKRSKEQRDSWSHNNYLERAERHFFLVEPGSVRDSNSRNPLPWDLNVSDSIPWRMPPGDANAPGSVSLNLDLSLGMTEKPVKQVFKFGDGENVGGANNDLSASLSLSLALPLS